MAINKQTLIGNLGKEPEVRQNGDFISCRFTVAVTEKGYTLQNGTQVPDHTEWFNIYCKNRLAQIVQQYVHKGNKVYIEGKTVTSEYTDQQGVQKRFTEVQADVLLLLTPKQQPQQMQPQQTYYPQNQYQQQPQMQFQQQAPQQQAFFQPQQQQQFQPQPQPQPQQPQAPVQGVFGQPAQVQGTNEGAPF